MNVRNGIHRTPQIMAINAQAHIHNRRNDQTLAHPTQQHPPPIAIDYRLLLATRSSSSFFLIAYEFELPLAALINSSARHSAMLLTLRKAASRAPIVRRAMAWLTRRSGETSTAWRRTVPAEPILVLSSRGPQLTMASTATWMGFWSVMMWICGVKKCFAQVRT